MNVYIAHAWKHWLLESLYPDANVIKVDFENPDPATICDKIIGDKFFFHLACTFPNILTPQRELLLNELETRGIQVFNGNVLDNSKIEIARILSTIGLPSLITSESGDLDEDVIIKTNFQNNGFRDVQFHVIHPKWNIPTPKIRNYGFNVMKRSAVNSNVWNDSDLVVQKYISNKENIMFKSMFHLGNTIVFIARMVGKFSKFAKTDEIYYEPDSLTSKVFEYTRIIAEHTKYDLFSMDVVMNNEREMFIIDINTTPHWGDKSNVEAIEFLLQ